MQIELRSEMPSVVQGPLPRSILSNARLRTSSSSRLGRRKPVSRRLFSRTRTSCEVMNARSPFTCPNAMGSTLLSTQVTPADFCNLFQRTSTPCERFDPHTRVELSLRYTPASTDAGCVGPCDTLPHREPVSRGLLTMACAHRVPLAWTRQIADRDRSSKGRTRALQTISRVPFS